MEHTAGRIMFRAEAEAWLPYELQLKTTTPDAAGRLHTGFAALSPPVFVKLAMTHIRAREIEQYRQMQHPATHKMVLKGSIPLKEDGSPLWKTGDRFISQDGHKFDIQTIPYEPLYAGIWTIMVVNEVVNG